MLPEKRLPALLLGLSIALSLVPLLLPRLLPLLDLPNHLAAAAIWHNLPDPSWGFYRYYTLNLAPVPYLTYYLPVHLLAYLLPLELANKAVLALYAVALPLSVLALGRGLGRSPWLSVLSVPFIFSYNLAYGFLPFVVGLPALFLGLASLHALLTRPGAGPFWRTLLCAVFCYFSHILVWGFLGLCAGGLLGLVALRGLLRLLARGRAAAPPLPPLRGVLWGAAALLPSVGCALFGLQKGAAADMSAAREVSGKLALEAVYLPIRQQWATLADRFLTGSGPVVPALLLLLLGTLLALHLSTPWRRRLAEESAPPTAVATVPGASLVYLLLALLLAVLLPFTLRKPFHYWNVGPRFFSVAALFALLTVRGPIVGRARLLLVPALCAVLGYPLWLTARFLSFNERAGGAVRLLDRLPRGSEVLVLPLGDRADPAVHKEVVPYTEFQSYAQVLVGGFNHVGWKLNFPYRIRWPRTPPTPHWAYPESFAQAVHGAPRDYVLTFRESRDHQVFSDRPEWRARVPLVARDGLWRLYRTRDVR